MHELRVFIFFLIFIFINDFLVNFVFVNITFNGLMIKLISIYGISCLHSTLFRNKYHREESNNNASLWNTITPENPTYMCYVGVKS